MAKTTPDTILLKSVNPTNYTEAPANGTITPGDLLELATDGDLQRGSTAILDGPMIVAMENDLLGESIDDDYTGPENVRAVFLQKGDSFYSFLPASATAVLVGSRLTLTGDGTVRLATGVEPTVAYAEEAVDNSGGGSKARLRARVI